MHDEDELFESDEELDEDMDDDDLDDLDDFSGDALEEEDGI
jgi:hypothetical protein